MTHAARTRIVAPVALIVAIVVMADDMIFVGGGNGTFERQAMQTFNSFLHGNSQAVHVLILSESDAAVKAWLDARPSGLAGDQQRAFKHPHRAAWRGPLR